MDVDEADILFAQKLADCDPAIRKKAFSKLRQWITARMRSEKGENLQFPLIIGMDK